MTYSFKDHIYSYAKITIDFNFNIYAILYTNNLYVVILGDNMIQKIPIRDYDLIGKISIFFFCMHTINYGNMCKKKNHFWIVTFEKVFKNIFNCYGEHQNT